MSHLHADNDELLNRVRRIAGQVQAIERALQAKADCGKTLHLVALNGLLEQIIEAHAQFHVADPGLSDEQRQTGVNELLKAIRQYSK
jgi:DNA-binding FrmR family transcriptional regulator